MSVDVRSMPIHSHHMKFMSASERRSFRRGPFAIDRIAPGLIHGERSTDTGIAGLGLIDHAHLSEGLLVAMHNHRNDEIVSYLKSGQMIHEDSRGDRAVLEPGFIMTMNAGSGISHEESVPVGSVHMLQIFVRPFAEDLPPHLQFERFSPAASKNAWRKVFGPEDFETSLIVRQRVAFLECNLEARAPLEIHKPKGFDTAFLYVIGGGIQIGQRHLSSGDSASWAGNESAMMRGGSGESDLALFWIDTSAKYSRSGSLSG